MTGLLSAARRAELLQAVQRLGSVQVNELASSLGVSASTIRRDLTILHDEGLLRRVHGGAMVTAEDVEPQRPDRAVVHAVEKGRIAAAGATLVEDGCTILITGGTTTELMLPLIGARRDLTVVTNSLTVAVQLAEHRHIELVVLGGYLRHGELSLLGHMTRRFLDDLIIDRTFTGAFGLDREGVTGANIAEAETDRHLVVAARELVVMADSSKFGRRGPVRLATAKQIAVLVTDDGAPEEDLSALRMAGADVILA